MSSKYHPTWIFNYEGSLKELAHSICKMRYDKVVEVLHLIGMELAEQSTSDNSKGRFKLSRALSSASFAIEEASRIMFGAWMICAPKMEPEKKEEFPKHLLMISPTGAIYCGTPNAVVFVKNRDLVTCEKCIEEVDKSIMAVPQSWAFIPDSPRNDICENCGGFAPANCELCPNCEAIEGFDHG